jgi:hypothetical protein
MSSPGVSASSFEFYEGIRILIPGAVVVALYAAVIETFGLAASSPKSDVLLALVATVLAGMVLYFLDVPAKAIVFDANLPHTTLEGWGVTPPKGFRHQNVYFVMLDTEVPAGIRDRALYMGSIFRIGFEAIYLLFGTAITTVLLTLLTRSGGSDYSGQGPRTVLLIGAGLNAALIVLAVLTAYQGNVFRKREHPWRDIWKRVRQQTAVFDLLVILAAGACAAWYLCRSEDAWLAATAVGLPALRWAFRYYRGFRTAPFIHGRSHVLRRLHESWTTPRNDRRNLDPLAGVLQLALAGVLCCLLAGLRLPDASVLNVGSALGWVGAMIVPGLLVISKGHERRLFGSYQAQRTWLELNREEVTKKFYSG